MRIMITGVPVSALRRLLQLSWETRMLLILCELGDQVAACFSGIVARVGPVDTA